MEELLKRKLKTFLLIETGHTGQGWISQGQSYYTDDGSVFVKRNPKAQARRMFVGEMASLEAILQTNTVTVPKPIKVIDMPGGGSAFVMEHLEMRSLNRYSAQLGEQVADLHLHNQRLGEKLKKERGTVGKGTGQSEPKFIDKFGFHVTTCCGYIPQVNDWQKDWVTFYTRQRIQPQMEMIEKESGDREALELWSQLQLRIPEMFCDIKIVPALIHGDLYGGNTAENELEPLLFDPASFYGHAECDLAVSTILAGFNSSFYSAYHSKIPKAPGFERRQKLYQLFHSLNQWNHFGTEYREQTLSIMRNLLH
ncbi:ketosamine-3-kinase-like isoform X1 [Rhinatrema bivittatum]|uniref:ketosamine-3-kinase-like isoform X1 n=2 Tax=Rhinatrema bivittatum TaxID=194408 RepID=UPI0011274901|nr:ketosamine-3-kinase-like isoform X1 [Rhinatrema bivittatum]